MLSRFYRGRLAELRRVSIGPDLVFGRLWRETGCAEVIRALLVGRRFGFDVERAIYLTVLHRLMVSGSDRHASRWHYGFRIPGAEELTLDHAYRAMTARRGGRRRAHHYGCHRRGASQHCGAEYAVKQMGQPGVTARLICRSSANIRLNLSLPLHGQLSL